MADAAPISPRRANDAELSVSELASALKRTIEDAYGHVRLRGEVFGYRGPHSSGHCYFALKDDKAKIDAVIWRGVFQGLRFKPEEGLEVVVTGKVTTYPGSSKYQIVVDSLEPAGAGALMALLEERKRKLAAEGLFAEARKKKLPFLPRVVGIITSPTGAVIRDMLHGFDERFPTRVIVWPVRVQGEASAGEVAAAIRGFNDLVAGGPVPRPDVLIVARGGGSLEDLWGFNEEIVVRAVAAGTIPLIAAVGHETDWTLIDLVADARAPTPTKAAEWAVPKRSDLLTRIGEAGQRLALAIARRVERTRQQLSGLARALPRPADLVALPRQRLDTAAARLPRALSAGLAVQRMRAARASAWLSPRLVVAPLDRAGDRTRALAERSRALMGRALERRGALLGRAASRLQPRTLRHELLRLGIRLGEFDGRRARSFDRLAQMRARALESQSKLLASLGYKNVLKRGYAIVRGEDGAMLRRAAAVAPGQGLEIELDDGRFGARATGPRPDEPTAPAADRSPRRGPIGGGGQGRLF